MSTTNQKRSRNIDLSRMRKHFAPKPLAIGIATVFIAGCTDNREQAKVFTDAGDCINQLPEQAAQCEAAYQQALAEASRTAPKYGTARDCEHDFGAQQCTQYRSNNGSSFFMPFMAGYMVSSLLSPRYNSQPMFTSYSRHSPYRNRWIGAGGYDFGDYRSRNVRVSKKAFAPKPSVSRTIKRGGFGSSVRAKSSWGSSRKGGWGG